MHIIKEILEILYQLPVLEIFLCKANLKKSNLCSSNSKKMQKKRIRRMRRIRINKISEHLQ